MSLAILHPSNDRMGFMLFLAAALHAFVILGISFQWEDHKRPEHRQQSLEVIVVRQPKELPKPDERPDFLAQTSQRGGGEQGERARPPSDRASLQAERRPPPPQKPRRTLTSEQASPLKRPADEAQPPTPPHPSAAQLYASRDQEIARVSADLERRTLAYSKRPRRKSINASTSEYKYAAYLDAWRRKVERIGNLNYPDEAKRRKLHGNLILHVAVKADGSLEQVKVLHSSGHKLLDDAAVRIVRLAAPFSPFPEEIHKETDVLDITRTWQFLRSNRFDSR